MKYYVVTVEQIYGEDGALTEYGKVEKVDAYNTALTKYYKKLSDVSAAIGNTHTYMFIQIMTSTGFVQKSDSLGEYQTVEPVAEVPKVAEE